MSVIPTSHCTNALRFESLVIAHFGAVAAENVLLYKKLTERGYFSKAVSIEQEPYR